VTAGAAFDKNLTHYEQQIQILRQTRDLPLPRLLAMQAALASVSANGAFSNQRPSNDPATFDRARPDRKEKSTAESRREVLA